MAIADYFNSLLNWKVKAAGKEEFIDKEAKHRTPDCGTHLVAFSNTGVGNAVA